jgi:hypothetical protein
MDSAVRARRNHYELLGLTPAATGDEIARAFAREMSIFRPHSFGGLAELSVAYETLRDPARRRVYDASIGLAPVVKPPTIGEGWHFVGSMRAGPVAKPAIDPLHRPARPAEPQPEPQVRPEPPIEQRVAAIAASLRELAKPAADAAQEPSAAPEPERQAEQSGASEPRSDADVDPVVEQILAAAHAEKEKLHHEGRSFEWKRSAVAATVLVLGVGLIGAWAGLEAGNEVEAEQAGKAVTLRVPQAKAAPATTVSEPDPAPGLSFVATRPERHVAVARPRIERAQPKLQRIASEERLADVAQALRSDANQATVQEAVAETAPVAATPTKMPLSDATIARTIGRIGYPCGQVAATTEGGAPGVFTVTCTSGHSYRAAPVRGRYHFRRVGKQ